MNQPPFGPPGYGQQYQPPPNGYYQQPPPPPSPQGSSFVGRTGSTAAGILLALFIFFIVIPLGGCIACGGCTTILSAIGASNGTK